MPHASAADGTPLKVFILVGQSNMQGHAEVSTFDHVGMDPATAGLLKDMRTADGSPTVCKNVWISSIGNDGTETEHHGQLTAGYGAMGRGTKIGPEFTFGIYTQKTLDEPILIIKTAWGGKSLHTDFRPPSAGPYEFNETQLANLKKQGKDIEQMQAERRQASGHYYRLMIEHVKNVLADIKRVYPKYDSDAGYELAGMVWFQGWNDMVDQGVYPNRSQPGGYAMYSELLAQFIRDVRRDLDAEKMPFVIGVMGVGGPVDQYGPSQQRYKSTHEGFRAAMAAPAKMPEFQGNVAAVLTEKYWDAELAELKARGGQIKEKSKELDADESLNRQQREAKLAEFREQLYTPRELEILKGSSNAEFHYNGSAKIMAQIGKGFADAIVSMTSTSK
ncbi:sialate O-acetylesterase [Stieleria varia]|nr:sialate O-acetylesterase [Stieleria varia]